MDYRVGFGYDSHRLSAGLPLVLGGVKIESPVGCVAHSDGDAVIHALCDALFGAAGLPDIGEHFPDTDPAYKQVDSKLLLQRSIALLHQQGWQVNQVDITLVLEKPKLATYKPLMRSCLASILQIPEDRMSIKAKTNEGMGFVGRQEGVAVYTVLTIKQ